MAWWKLYWKQREWVSALLYSISSTKDKGKCTRKILFSFIYFSINFLKIEDTWVRLKIQTIRGLSKKLSLLPQLLLSRVTTIVSYLWEAIIFFLLIWKTIVWKLDLTMPLRLKSWGTSFIILMRISQFIFVWAGKLRTVASSKAPSPSVFCYM